MYWLGLSCNRQLYLIIEYVSARVIDVIGVGFLKYVLFIFCSLLAVQAHAHGEAEGRHSGGTNSQGCHAGSQPYHCHTRPVTTTQPVVTPPTPVVVAPTPVVPPPMQCVAPSAAAVSRALADANTLESRLLAGLNTSEQVIDWANWHLTNYPSQSTTWNRLISLAQELAL